MVPKRSFGGFIRLPSCSFAKTSFCLLKNLGFWVVNKGEFLSHNGKSLSKTLHWHWTRERRSMKCLWWRIIMHYICRVLFGNHFFATSVILYSCLRDSSKLNFPRVWCQRSLKNRSVVLMCTSHAGQGSESPRIDVSEFLSAILNGIGSIVVGTVGKLNFGAHFQVQL